MPDQRLQRTREAYRFDDFLGYVKLTMPGFIINGQTGPSGCCDHFDSEGRLLSSRPIAPLIAVTL